MKNKTELQIYRRAFGAAVRDLRKNIRLTQQQLADMAKIHRTYISDIERGKRNVAIDNIVKLSFAMCISPAALMLNAEQKYGTIKSEALAR